MCLRGTKEPRWPEELHMYEVEEVSLGTWWGPELGGPCKDFSFYPELG